MALHFRSSAHSEIGLVRKNNQDSAYASADLVIVADGMGGAAAGDLASAVAIAEVAALDAQLAEGAPATPESGLPPLLGALESTVDRSNARIAALVASEPSFDGMGTTLCGFALHEDQGALLNIGDSRAYLIRDGELMRVSHDHSWVQTLVDSGRLTEAEALEHPHRSLILRVINGKPGHVPDLELFELRAGDRVLVCSDGLCGLVTDEQIAARFGPEDSAVVVASLVDLAHEAGGYDNITIIVADVYDGAPFDQPRILGAAENTLLQTAPEDTAQLPAIAEGTKRRGGGSGRRGGGNAEDARYNRRGRGRPVLRIVAAIILPLALLLGGGYAWYSVTQTRYYLGPNATTVAVYQGVPDTVLGFPLSHVVYDEGVLLANLPPTTLETVTNTIQVDSLASGQERMAELSDLATQCQQRREQRATTPPTSPSPSPSKGASATPKHSPTSASPTPTTTATVTTPSAAEEC